MVRSLWRNLARKLIAASLLGVGVAGYSAAQEIVPLPTIPIGAPVVVDNGVGIGSPVAVEEAQGGGGGAGLDKKAVEGIIASYMKKSESDKKKKDADAAKEFAEVGKDLTMKVTWNNGINFATSDKAFVFHVGGRVHFDAIGAFEQTAGMPDFINATGFRRARLQADGTMWEVFKWSCEYDFAQPDSNTVNAAFTDVFVEVTQLPVIGNFRVGHFKEPFSMEEQGSSRYLTFLERSVINVFSPARNPGAMVYRNFGDEERALGAIGLFRPDTNNTQPFEQGDGEWAVTMRGTALPFWEEDGRCLLHVGAAYSYRTFDDRVTTGGAANVPSLTSKAEVRLGTPGILATGALNRTDNVNLFGLEASGNLGSLNFMSEMIVYDVERVPFGTSAAARRAATDLTFWGWYAQASYFLTGEHRPYKKSSGAWDRVKPIENFFMVEGEDGNIQRGWGAWEVAARYSYIDLRSQYLNLTGADRSGGSGIQNDLTLGVNWYWNPNMKWQFNYIYAQRFSDQAGRDGNVDVWAMRFAWDF